VVLLCLGLRIVDAISNVIRRSAQAPGEDAYICYLKVTKLIAYFISALFLQDKSEALYRYRRLNYEF